MKDRTELKQALILIAVFILIIVVQKWWVLFFMLPSFHSNKKDEAQ